MPGEPRQHRKWLLQAAENEVRSCTHRYPLGGRWSNHRLTQCLSCHPRPRHLRGVLALIYNNIAFFLFIFGFRVILVQAVGCQVVGCSSYNAMLPTKAFLMLMDEDEEIKIELGKSRSVVNEYKGPLRAAAKRQKVQL